MGNIVNNVGADGGLPEVTSEVSGTPKQIYRNTDGMSFFPVLIVAVNLDTTTIQKMILVDADLTDSGEDDNKGEDKAVFRFTVAPEDTTILTEKDLAGLVFRYGIGAYNSTSKSSGSGVVIYVAGEEK